MIFRLPEVKVSHFFNKKVEKDGKTEKPFLKIILVFSSYIKKSDFK